MASGSERRIAAILVADVVGYSHMMEADESGTIAAIKALRADVINPYLEAHRGRVVKLLGDGMIAEFVSVVDAVKAAVDTQRALAARTSEVSEHRIALRIGINLGDVVIDGDDLLGDGVNIAARLEQLCKPGEVLISGTVFDQLQGKFALPIEFVGEQRVKNLERPVRAYRVRLEGTSPRWRNPSRQRWRLFSTMAAASLVLVLAGAGYWLLKPAETESIQKPAVAVLPFEAIGGDDTSKRLAHGITEDVISDLARYRSVEVIARNSTAIYEGKPVDVREVGRDLDVQYAIEGSVQSDNDQIRITVQLVDARSAGHLWSQRWDRPFADFFALQTEISEQVAAQLVGWNGVIPADQYKARRHVRPQDMTVYDNYLRASEAIDRFTKESVAEAIPLLESAVREEPAFADAWSTLGSAYQATTEFGADPEEMLPKARAAVERAIQLDPMNADAHAAFGLILGHQGDWKRSEAEFETALALNPGSAGIMAMFSVWASAFGDPKRGADLADRSIRLNPRHPAGMTGPFSYTYIMADRYEDALHVLERQAPDNYTIYSWVFRAICNAKLGRRDEARTWMTRTLEQHPTLTIEGFLGTPAWSDAERKLFTEAMRQAEFPACAAPKDRSSAMATFLPECQTP